MSMETVGARGGVAVSPSNTVPVAAAVPRGFQVAVAGDVALKYADGSTVTWPACVAGVLHPHFGFTHVMATGTTATGVVVAI